MGFLSDEELATLIPSELVGEPTPIPTQIVSSDEYFPRAAERKQSRWKRACSRWATSSASGGRQPPRFFQTARRHGGRVRGHERSYGALFDVDRAEAATPDMAQERAERLKTSSSWTCTRISCATTRASDGFVRQREAVGKAGWNPALAGKPQTIEDLKFANYFKEIYPRQRHQGRADLRRAVGDPQDWFLTNEMKARRATR